MNYKKSLKVVVLFLLTYVLDLSANNSHYSTAQHYIINLTGRTVMMKFYAKNPLTGKDFVMDLSVVQPLLIGGKVPASFPDNIGISLLPSPVDMHPMTSHNVKFEVMTLNSTTLKDSSFQSISMPSPNNVLIPHDFKITLDGNQLVVTQLNTSALLPIPGAKKSEIKQWPSVDQLALNHMSPQDKLKYLQDQNNSLQNSIKKWKKEIKKYVNPVKISNRKKSIRNAENQIDSNNKQIAQLQAQIATVSTVPTA